MNTPLNVIPVFDVKVNFDLAGTPKVILTNASVGSMVGCLFSFTLISPFGDPIHTGSFAPADANGTWSKYVFLEDMPFLGDDFVFGQYTIVCKVKVGDDIYEFSRTQEISLPLRNNACSDKVHFAIGSFDYKVLCNKAKVQVTDSSSYSWMGKTGNIIQRKFTLNLPADTTNIFPDPISVSGFKSVQFNLPYNAKGYKLFLETTVEYNLGNNIYVTLLYKRTETFDVACNVDLAVVLREMAEFRNKVICDKKQEDIVKLIAMQGLLLEAIIGKMQPDAGIDTQASLNKIISIGGFTCKSLYEGTGISEEACGCDSCKTFAALAEKASSSGIYNLLVLKEQQHDCNKIELRKVIPEIINILGEYGFAEIVTTTIPMSTVPPTTVPATTLAPTTVPATTTEPRFTAYWGWKDTNAILTDTLIRASTNFDSFPLGSYVNADFRSNNVLKYLWVAIPVSEEAPISYYANALSQGGLGNDSLFAEPVITEVGGFYFIISNYKSKQTQNKIQLRY